MGEQVHRNERRNKEEVAEDLGRKAVEGEEQRESLSDDVDAILDEIDAVLEPNAEEFVKSYVQKGGQ
jgi:prokaryotic ubiquitin-like protein Pup